MDHVRDSRPRAPIALGVLFVIVCIAGIAAAVGWLALVLDKPRLAPSSLRASGVIPVCNICGVVEQVREVQARRPAGIAPSPEGLLGRTAGLQLNGDRGEGVVMLLAALGGTLLQGGETPPLYETAVLLDDGSVRVMREYGPPQWKQGDRVKVMRGRIEPLS